MRIGCVSAVLLAQVALGAAAQDAAFVEYADARPILEMLREDFWPAEFRGRRPAEIEADWPAWAARHDAAIRGRVAGGEDETIVHLLLFGTSFTGRPRATERDLAALVRAPAAAVAALRPRLDDFVAALAAPGRNERLQFARQRLAARGIDVSSDAGRAAARAELEKDTKRIGADAPPLKLLEAGTGAADARTLFRGRGLSSDTSIFVDYGIDRALEALRDQRVLAEGRVRRVAIVGPGLDIVDEQHGYDFYPQQTLQPFAAIDSLLRYGLAEPERLQVTAFDVSPRVVEHLQKARERARQGSPYTIVLPRDPGRPWSEGLAAYRDRLGNWIGDDAPPPAPPAAAGRVEVRGVAVRPEVVLSVAARDLDVVLQRLDLRSPDEQFDLVIATNVLPYYDVFEQSLAVANIGRMLRPGGILLSNNPVFELPALPVTAVGATSATYMTLPGIGETGDRIVWYQRQ